MPPRHTYWTIILEGKPTAFRAHTQDELLPTLRQLQSQHPDAVLMWFARGRLWKSEEESRAAHSKSRPTGDRRGPAWRPGGSHEDPRARFKIPRDEKRRRFRERLFGKDSHDDLTVPVSDEHTDAPPRRPMLRARNPPSTNATSARRPKVRGRQYQPGPHKVRAARDRRIESQDGSHAALQDRAVVDGNPIVLAIKAAATGIAGGSPVVLPGKGRAGSADGYQPGPLDKRAAARAAGSPVGREASGVAAVQAGAAIAGGSRVVPRDKGRTAATVATVSGSRHGRPDRAAAIAGRNQVVRPDRGAAAIAAGNRAGPRGKAAAAIARGSPIARPVQAVAAAIGAGSQVGLQGDPLVDAAGGHQEAADGRVAEDRRDDLSRGSVQAEARAHRGTASDRSSRISGLLRQGSRPSADSESEGASATGVQATSNSCARTSSTSSSSSSMTSMG